MVIDKLAFKVPVMVKSPLIVIWSVEKSPLISGAVVFVLSIYNLLDPVSW